MPTTYLSQNADGQGFQYKETVAGGANSDPIVVKGFIDIGITVKPGVAGATLQFSTDSLTIIESGAGINWKNSDAGLVTALSSEILIKAIAIRLMNGVDASDITVIA